MATEETTEMGENPEKILHWVSGEEQFPYMMGIGMEFHQNY